MPNIRSSGIIDLTIADVNKMMKALMKEKWPKWSSKNYSLRKDPHGNWYTDLFWTDHVTKKEMEALLDHLSKKGDYFGPPIMFEQEGKKYCNSTYIRYHRYYSKAFLERIAIIFCRKHQVRLPEIQGDEIKAKVREEANEPYIDGYTISKAIMIYASTVDEADLERLEKEADEQYPPIPGIDPELQAKRDAEQLARDKMERANNDYLRQEYQYRLAVLKHIPGREELVAKLEGEAAALAKAVRKLNIDLYEPVFCTACWEYVEEEQAIKVNHPHLLITRWICKECHSQEKQAFPPDPQKLLEEIQQLDEEEQKPEQEPYTPVIDEDMMFIAKNGERMPILTRDLLHDVRTSKWWMWFEEKPSDEVRKALKEAGWHWGWGRKQHYHPNAYGILHIPEIIYEEYGGYVDGGFCDYRSTRGERLRAYADKVEGKADEMAEWSDAIVAKYMATGSIITGGRRTRKLQKEKARAEKKAAESRRLDEYAQDLRKRANRSESWQQYLASDEMLDNRLVTINTDLRKLDRDFDKYVETIAWNLQYKNGKRRSVRWHLNEYVTYVEPRKDIIQEEIDLIQATIEARKAGKAQEPEEPVPVPVPDLPERHNAVEDVIEVNVGPKNRSELFPTLPDIGDLILDQFPIPREAKFVLEPNGGTGSYLKRIAHHLEGTSAQIHTYELLYDLNVFLKNQGYNVLGSDFLDAELPDEVKEHGGYDAIAMNPPFGQWELHLLRAWKLIKEEGSIRCTIPRDGEKQHRFIKVMQKNALEFEVFDLPDDAFKQSNTNVRTSVLYVVKKLKKEEPPIPEPFLEPVQPVEEHLTVKEEPVAAIAKPSLEFPSTPLLVGSTIAKKQKKTPEGAEQLALF